MTIGLPHPGAQGVGHKWGAPPLRGAGQKRGVVIILTKTDENETRCADFGLGV
jgi:hypothetical protein